MALILPGCCLSTWLLLLLLLVSLHNGLQSTNAASQTKERSSPNIVILFADNLAYEDVGAFSVGIEPSTKTPRLDDYAKRGRKLFNWNSPAVLCSASRAALLTGRYPIRTGIYPRVFAADAQFGLLPEETTLAEFLKDAGYATKIVGKWHLGQRPQYLPTQQGFDEWFGIPYHMSGGSVDDGGICGKDTNGTMWLPLFEGNSIVEQPVILEQLAPRYVDESVRFIQANVNDNRPFLLYLAFSHVHQLCAPRIHECQWASTHFSRNKHIWNATFDDSLQEMDWIAGKVLDSLQELGVDNNTLVLFTSDNGPWVAEQSCSGRKGPFQGQWLKENVPLNCTACPSEYVPATLLPHRPRRCVYPQTTDNQQQQHYHYEVDGIHCGEDTGLGSAWEANIRMPAFAMWPGKIEPGSESMELISTLDVVPTLLSILGKTIPESIDGIDASHVLFGTTTSIDDDNNKNRNKRMQSSNRSLFIWRDGFQGGPLPPPFGKFDVVAMKMLQGRFKLFFSTKSSHYNDDPVQYHDPPLIFDVIKDPAESQPLNPEEYRDLIDQAYQELEAHRNSIDWERTHPLCLARGAQYLPCADKTTKCRTHVEESGKAQVETQQS